MPRILAVLVAACAIAGCGKSSQQQSPAAAARSAGLVVHEAVPGAVSIVTKNTTRLGGADPASDAAAIARTVFPGLTRSTQPSVVVLADQNDWPAALAASALASAPLSAAILFSEGHTLPAVTADALRSLHPTGAAALGGTQLIAVGAAAHAQAHASASELDVPGATTSRGAPAGAEAAAEAATAIARVLTRARGGPPHAAIVVDLAAPRALQMPAAALAAESGAPILYVNGGSVPAASASALRRLHRPAIYVVGASAPGPARGALSRYGRVSVIAPPGPAAHGGSGPEPASENAIAVARFGSGSFGWNIHEAGHGLTFANISRPLDAPAAAPLAAHGDYAPLLLLESAAAVPTSLARYLANIQPGYSETVPPVRSVYNHGWLIGDESAISVSVQAQLDAMLEIAPRSSASEEATLGPGE